MDVLTGMSFAISIMNSFKWRITMFKKTASALGISLLATTAFAQNTYEGNDDGWRYQPEFSIGAGYGVTTLKDEDFDEDEAAKKVFAVMKFNQYVGIEAGYIDFDEAGNSVVSLDPTGMTAALILEAPIAKSFSIYAKGGQMWWDGDASVENDLFSASDDYDGDETFWGVGTKIRLTEHLDLRIEYERFNFDISRDEIDVLQANDIDMDVDYASANLQFTF